MHHSNFFFLFTADANSDQLNLCIGWYNNKSAVQKHWGINRVSGLKIDPAVDTLFINLIVSSQVYSFSIVLVKYSKIKKGHHKGSICALKRPLCCVKWFWLFFYKIESKQPCGSFHTYKWDPVSVFNGQCSSASDAAVLPGNGINSHSSSISVT